MLNHFSIKTITCWSKKGDLTDLSLPKLPAKHFNFSASNQNWLGKTPFHCFLGQGLSVGWSFAVVHIYIKAWHGGTYWELLFDFKEQVFSVSKIETNGVTPFRWKWNVENLFINQHLLLQVQFMKDTKNQSLEKSFSNDLIKSGIRRQLTRQEAGHKNGNLKDGSWWSFFLHFKKSILNRFSFHNTLIIKFSYTNFCLELQDTFFHQNTYICR